MNIVGKLVWRAQAVMDKVEKQVQQNMDKAAIYLVNDIKKHFGSPSAMPERQLTPYGIRKLASRAKKKQARATAKNIRAAKKLHRSLVKRHRQKIIREKKQHRTLQAMKREATALARANKHEIGD